MIKYEMIYEFIVRMLPNIRNKINIIIVSSDMTFPLQLDQRLPRTNLLYLNKYKSLTKHKYINKIFVENLDSVLPNTYPIPLGVISPNTNFNYYKEFINIDINKPLKFTNLNRLDTGKGQWKERQDVFNLSVKDWKEFYIGKKDGVIPHKKLLKKMADNLFTICVHGGGIDVNPKLWESLILGVIPIIKENKPYTDLYIDLDLPVVIVKEWTPDLIHEKNLIQWRNTYYSYFTDSEKRAKMLEILSLDYWIRYISEF